MTNSRRLAVAVGALVALALPSVASAHPGVYTVTQITRPSGQTCTYPDTSCLSSATTQYAIANDGWALGFTESNGLNEADPADRRGMINYKTMPSGWRTPMTSEQKRAYEPAQTNIQAHATCLGSALLDTPANILAWQGNDPFFNYVPWQKESANLGDEPEEWLDVVKTATGVDLTTLSTPAQFEAACESAPVNGTYYPSDTPSKITGALESAITEPYIEQVGALEGNVSTLQSQVDQLKNQVTTLQAAKVAADQAAASAETARQTADSARQTAETGRAAAETALRAAEQKLARPLALTLGAKRFAAPVAMVTGSAGTRVTVTVRLTAANARELKLSRTIASARVTLGERGAALVSPKLSKKAARAIKRHGHALKLTIQAAGGGKTVSKSATLTV